MHRIALAVVLSASLASAAHAAIPEGDVFLEVDGGSLITGLISEDGLEIVRGPRVFFAEFGTVAPNIADEPGFQSLPTGLGGATTFRFDIQKALRTWNGADFSTVATESLTADLGPLSVTSPASDATVPGFSIPVSPTGTHQHPDWTLNAPASDGVYLLEVRFITSVGQQSLPVWMLWGQNAGEPTAQAAYDYAVATIPAPASLALQGVACVACTRRRRAHAATVTPRACA
jgi:hypothetical protein